MVVCGPIYAYHEFRGRARDAAGEGEVEIELERASEREGEESLKRLLGPDRKAVEAFCA